MSCNPCKRIEPHRNSCYCGTLESTCAVIEGGYLLISVEPLQMYKNYKYYWLDICLALPQSTGIEPVAITDGVNTYPLIDTNGQPVVAGKISGHKPYRVRYGSGGAMYGGTMPQHFTVYSDLCPMKYSSNAALQTLGAGG